MHAAQAMVVLVTTAHQEEAERLARLLLDNRLIACANIVPQVRSLFRWEGRVECQEESLLVMKTTIDALPALQETVTRHHSYDLPEIVALPLTGGSAEYLSWVASQVQPQSGSNEK